MKRYKGLWMTLMLAVLMSMALPVRVWAPESDTQEQIFLSPATCGIYVIDLATGDVVLEQNAGRLYIPASVTKALTTASVMLTRSDADVFYTPAWLCGEVKESPSGNTLMGDVILCTVGDPSLEAPQFTKKLGLADSIASALVRRGIKRIEGRVIVDGSYFTDNSIPSGWPEGDLTHAYGAPMHGSTYRHNMVGSRVNRRPDTLLAADVSRAIMHRNIWIEGTPFPDEVRDNPSRLYVHNSLPYSEIMHSLMVRSDNLFAEGMLRTLAPGRSRADALEVEWNIWTDPQLDISTDGVKIVDGSGLSRQNRMTPRFLAQVLASMADTRVFERYVALFPRVGREGTVRGLLKGTPLEGKLALKSGSMTGVQCYAGYALDDDNRPTHVVVVMCNNFTEARPTLKENIGRTLLRLFAPQEGEPDQILDAEELYFQ